MKYADDDTAVTHKKERAALSAQLPHLPWELPSTPLIAKEVQCSLCSMVKRRLTCSRSLASSVDSLSMCLLSVAVSQAPP